MKTLFPNQCLPYLHVHGCWERQIVWENSHITTQWEREWVMCSKQKKMTAMALTPSKCLFSTQPNHRQSVSVLLCVCKHVLNRVVEDNGSDVTPFWLCFDPKHDLMLIFNDAILLLVLMLYCFNQLNLSDPNRGLKYAQNVCIHDVPRTLGYVSEVR